MKAMIDSFLAQPAGAAHAVPSYDELVDASLDEREAVGAFAIHCCSRG